MPELRDTGKSALPTRTCAVCGSAIRGASVPIAGVYGKGVRHADNSICTAFLAAHRDDE